MILKRFKNSFIQTEEDFKKLLEYSNSNKTPKLIFDLNKLEKNYDELVEAFDYSKIYYAIKANPMKEVIELLNSKGSNFDAATIYEIDYLLNLGVLPEKISYGNTIKKREDVKKAYEKGVNLFVTDSESDLENIAKYAPKSRVFVRVLTSGTGAEWPLSRKFGCHPTMAIELLIKAKKLGLIPYGISFHVGSQQLDVGQWDEAIAKTKFIFDSLNEQGIELRMINMGGGLPTVYREDVPSVKFYADRIKEFLSDDFDNIPEIYIEPGRSLVADCGIIQSKIIQVSKKGEYAIDTWVYLDIGMFNGLIETIGESIKYDIVTLKNGKLMKVVLAGPTCDSMDILYEDTPYYLPEDLVEGDSVYILGTGAYTLTYSAVWFNGISPLEYIIF